MTLQPTSFEGFKKHLAKFTTISSEEFAKVLTYFTVRKVKKNEVLVKTGESVSHTWWILKGLVTSNFTDRDGKEHVIQFAIENCWITDQNAFYNRETAMFSIVALEDSEMLCLSFDNRERLCADMHNMERFFRRKANDSFTKQQRRLLTYLSSDAKRRYEILLAEHPDLIQRLSKKTLAAYIGVSRETLSRLGK
ncbi:MAG TPA: Crp/Fnr family transcriptional regulator [Cyclobacteriaceae bacterium]|nr:Crp/Fnr family transcriptional regulator [Cyclobacteriaceae bacterium]